jgi:UDP-N-acetylmuramoyl-tripeptide--D-alanyl-D-alanine ligase
MKIESLHRIFLENPSVCTDTRTLKKNDIFFALKGEHFNGNAYAAEALNKGARYAVVDEEAYADSPNCILVPNALQTLQQLANFHRHHCKAKIIALTGSNGKTTTKELIYTVLSKKYNTIATNGNLNNHIGVPLTLLRIENDTELAVVEMGANHQKEIAFLSAIAEPDFGYITNFGKAHLEGFGGVKGVIKGKSELYDFLIANNKKAFFNADDPIQVEKLNALTEKFGFSEHDGRYYPITLLSTEPFLKIGVEHLTINTQLIGTYNFTNCCAAITMGKYFNVALDDISEAIASYVPKNNRSQIIDKNGLHIVMDAYNANPTSMEAALKDFAKGEFANKFLFLGDMFEMGEYAALEHQKIADLALNLGFQNVFLIGENFAEVSSKFQKVNEFSDLEKVLKSFEFPKGSEVLIKGSRGMALERILEFL